MEAQAAPNNDRAIIQDLIQSLLKEQLAKEVQRQLAEQLASQAKSQTLEKPEPLNYDRELFERVVRVEEELKHQRELLQQNQELLKIFMQQVDKRFEQVDKRFLMLQWFMGIGFGLVISVLGLLKFL